MLKRILKYMGLLALCLLVAFNLYLLITGQFYAHRALIYTNPDLDDYKMFDNRVVKHGEPQPWPKSARYNKARLPDEFLQSMRDLETVSFVVIKNDSLLAEHYFSGYSKESMSNSFSMAKSIVSILTGIALKEGKIGDLDEPVGKYLPEFKEGLKSSITIRHLLTMSSGLNWDESYSSLLSQTTEGYYGKDLEAQVMKLKVIEKPGTICRYKSGDTQLLELLLRKATGKTISEYASEVLWTKIGAEKDALWCLDRKDGNEKAYCCFNAGATDFARIGSLYLHNGKWKGNQLVPPIYVNASLTPNKIPDEKNEVTNYYGFMWWLEYYNSYNVFYARGIKGQFIIVIPEENIVIVRLGEKRSPKKDHWFQECEDMIDIAIQLADNKVKY